MSHMMETEMEACPYFLLGCDVEAGPMSHMMDCEMEACP